MNPLRRRAALSLGAAALTGCSGWRLPAHNAMDVLYDDRACPRTQAPVLLVFLPGANMAPAELEQEGFVAALRQRHMAVDVRLPDAHMGFVHDGSMLERLDRDVIGPARAQGYQRIWLAGISLGGFVALAYAMTHPGEVEGVLCIAPYLGPRALIQDMAAAGGPAAWRQKTPTPGDAPMEQRVWSWLAARPASTPPLWLAHGTEDRFAEGHRMLADLLPPERVASTPGGHTWAPWKRLWAQWLDRGLLPGNCAA